jgi:uncharacterized protein YcbK (DUF882 family)
VAFRLGKIALAASLAALPVARETAADSPVPHGMGLATRKAPPSAPRAPLLATLVQTHTEERVMLDAAGPDPERFAVLLGDRITGSSHPMDARLLDLLRRLAEKHGTDGAASEHPKGCNAVRIELVSGFRSPKLNEMMRKKGHHVASHSQHSLGHALDFRIVRSGDEKAMDPRVLEQEIRALGWDGGVGVYTLESDWFVHADVGPNRRWGG